MLTRINQTLLGNGVISPKNKDQMIPLFGKRPDGGIGKLFPAMARMRSGLSGPNGKGSIQEQHPFPSPFLQVAGMRHGNPQVGIQLLENVLKTWRERHSVGNRERKAMGLSWTMIGILSQNHDLHLVEGSKVEGIKDQRAWRIHRILPFFVDQKRLEFSEIGCFKLGPEHLIPAFINGRTLYFHGGANFLCKDGNNFGKNPLFCKIIPKQMKRIAIVLLTLLVASIAMSSCKSSSCAAYGETSKYQIETRY